jgi:SAM-dependent methyltransferase
MLARARTRAAGMGNVDFVLADATTYVPPAPVDLVFSRFGVMFFADPAASFANIARALRPGGRVVFVCWRALDANEWASVPFAAAKDVFPPAPPAAPDAPGPFAFADPARVRAILGGAGLREVAVDAFDTEVVLSEHGLDEAMELVMQTGPLARRARESDDATRARAAEAVRAALAARMRGNHLALRGATWIVHARRP